MSFDARWARWISASLVTYITDNRNGLTVYFEGAERQTSDIASFVEVRIDGPHFQQHTAANWQASVLINVLLHHSHTLDLFAIEDMIGKVCNIFGNSIPVYQYGTSDSTLVDCMQRKPQRGGKDHVVHRYGQPHEKTKVTLVTVEILYQLEL